MKTLDASTCIELENVLFTTDFSPTATATAALPCAVQLAKRFGANLIALHVRTPVIDSSTPPAGWPALEQAAEVDDRAQAQSLRKSIQGLAPKILIEQGDILSHVMETIEERHVDLLVIGTHGRSGVGKLLLGSTAERILRQAHCPVLTVGPHVSEESNPDGQFHRILYATSFKPGSTVAASYAISLAQEFQAHLTLLHVLEEAKPGEIAGPQDFAVSTSNRLAHLVPPEADLWCAPDYCVDRGAAAQTILDVARRCNADLIVIGMQRPSGVPGADTHLSFSTTHKVVSEAACPVLTIRS